MQVSFIGPFVRPFKHFSEVIGINFPISPKAFDRSPFADPYSLLKEINALLQIFCYKSSLCNPEGMLRKARERKFVCLRKPQPAPDFRGPAASIPPLYIWALF